jgi:hypothetical protein
MLGFGVFRIALLMGRRQLALGKFGVRPTRWWREMDSSFRNPVATVSEGSHFGRRHWLLEYGSGSLKAGSKNFKSLALILFALRARRAAMAGSRSPIAG